MNLLEDVRYAWRMIAKNPVFTTAAVLCLALGIGATTAIFSVVNAVVLSPLPYRDPGQLVRIYSEFPTQGGGGGLRRFWISPPEYLDLQREAKKNWQTIGAWVNGGANLTGAKEPIRVTASYVTGDLLNSLGVSPMLGRQITPRDDTPSPSVVLLSYGLWQRAFGSDRSVIGRNVYLDAQKCIIIGVMPKGFDFPPGEADRSELWFPVGIDPAHPGGRGSHFLSLIGRIKSGVTPSQGIDELKALVQQWGAARTPKSHAFDPKFHPIVAFGFQDEVVRTVRPAMLTLLGAVVFVLLISCVNVANLLLARSESRQREMAIRKAMGAKLARLVGQLSVEGIVLSLMGAVLGVALAYGAVMVIKASNAGSIPRVSEIGIDTTVLLFTLAVSLCTGIVFGLAPLIHLVTQNVQEALKASANRTTATAGANNFRSALVVAELTLALVLLIGAGLMVRAFWKLQDVDPGFNPRGILTMQTSLPQNTYMDGKSIIRFWNDLLERASHIPGAEATMVTGLPPIRPINANTTVIEGFVPVPGGPTSEIDYYQIVADRYFEIMGIPLLEGRLFDERDGENGPPAVIVNQTLARNYWPHQDAIGRHIDPNSGRNPKFAVVGVVADVKNAGLDHPTGSEVYFPFRQTQSLGGPNPAYLILKSKADPRQLAGAGRTLIQSIDPSLPVDHVRTMEDVISAAQSRPRFLTLLLTIFSLVALGLAAVGIYGVISYSVAQRTAEFGIRVAMGASANDVLGMVLAQGMGMVVVGVLLGCIGAAGLTRFLSGLLFGVSSFDALTFIAMAAVLILVALAACYIPARRATKVDPMTALRYE